MNSYDNQQLDRLEPSYLAQFGLREAPFSALHDDRFLYLDAERSQHLNMLQHLIQYSDLLLIVNGEQGIGKTSLMQRCIKTADQDWRICQVDANAMMNADQLLHDVARGFGLQALPQDPPRMQEALYEYLTALHHDSLVPILIIDDAHELPEDALESLFLLADAQTGDSNLLRIILFCQPCIEDMLQASAIQPLRERVTHTLDIHPLSEEQTAEYIKYRLSVAGLDGGSPITPKVSKKIHKNSMGVPAAINKLAHKILRDGSDAFVDESPYAHDLQIATSSIRRRNIFLGGAILIIITLALLMQDPINRMFEDEMPVIEAAKNNGEQTTIDLTPPNVSKGSTESSTQKIIELSINQATQEVAVETTDDTSATNMTLKTATTLLSSLDTPLPKQEETETKPTDGSLVVDRPKKTMEDTPDSQTDPSTPLTISNDIASAMEPNKPILPEITRIHPHPVIGSKRRQTLTLTGERFSPDARVTVTWSSRSKQLAKSQVTVNSEHEIQITIVTGINPDNWTTTVTDPKQGRSNTLSFRVIAPKLTNELKTAPTKVMGEDWFKSKNPQRFTLQLLGTRKQQAIQKFIKDHKLKGEVALFKSQRSGGIWYNLVKGDYATRQQALAAMRQLSDKVKTSKPWIRRFADIQATIKSSSIAKTKFVTPRPKSIATTLPNVLSDQTSWLWSQDPRHYTLQLLGTRQEGKLRKFITKHDLKGKAVYFSIQQNGKDWFALVFGVYPNRDAALKARNLLSGELRKASPWARSFASIHLEMARSTTSQSP